MTNKMEGLVRPFAAGDVFTAKALPAVQPNYEAKPDIVVTIGKPIPLLMKAIGITNLFGGVRLQELDRRTSTKRVFNDQDEEQWVDVSRIDYLKLRDNATEQEHEWNFNN